MNPIIIGIETATDACSVAISVNHKIFMQYVVAPQDHSKLLLDMISSVCSEAGISLKDVDAFAYGKGPGSFTGLRIAASMVQGLAFGVSKPVIAVSSLQALAQQAYNNLSEPNILALLDARMQEVYWGIYKINSQGLVVANMQDSLHKPGEIILECGGKFLAVGSGCSAYGELLLKNNCNLMLDPKIEYPRAKEVVQLAIAQYAVGNFLTPEQAVPTYVRNNVAQKSKKIPT